MAVILNIEMPECCDLCLFGCWSTLHQTAACYLMSDTQMFDDFSTEYKTRRSVNCPMEQMTNDTPYWKERMRAHDAISRQAAIDGADSIIARDTSGNNDVVKAMTAWKSYVEALPSAQTEQQWIPCSERMPEKSECYLVSGKWANGRDDVDDCVFSRLDGCFETAWGFDVLAWMPLPKPWEGDEK